MDLKVIKKFVELMDQTDIVELRWEKKGLKVGIKRGETAKNNKADASSLSLQNNKAINNKEELKPENSSNGSLLVVKSPMVGTFYYSSSPDEPAYIQLGDKIKVGQKIGVIEAMKIMKEVASPYEGRVVEMLIQNGRPVEYGQEIITIEPGKKK